MAWLNKRENGFFLLAAAGLAIIFFALCLSGWPRERTNIGGETAYRKLTINGLAWQAEIASDPARQYQGLSGRASLDPSQGMLFVFPERQEREFVMRDMAFPLDIIFIDEGRIIRIFSDLPPEGKTPEKVYASGQPADMVFELNAGQALEHGLEVGQSVTIE